MYELFIASKLRSLDRLFTAGSPSLFSDETKLGGIQPRAPTSKTQL
jgi:hypothetical protein